jgi:nucleoside-diphosphate-sugar epimerase
MKLCLVTGASGFVGGHIAERLIREGWRVRTVVRPSSRQELLREWGVERVEGDLTDDVTLRKAVDGVHAIVHAAAKVGEWGSLDDYRRVNVEGLKQLFAVCPPSLDRFVLISSLGVYPARDHDGTDESCLRPERHIDGYTQSKAEADRVALEHRGKTGLPLVILRPGFVYGPRDRTVLPRIIKNLRRGLVTYFGSPTKKLNQIYVGNIADAVVLALTKPEAVGGVFNIRDAELVTKEHFFNTVADLVGFKRPSRRIPMAVGKLVCAASEFAGKTFGFEPTLTSAKIKFMGYNLDYGIEKAKRELGYAPNVGFDEGMRRAIDWLKASGELETIR